MRFKPLILALALTPVITGFAFAKGPVSGHIQAYIVSIDGQGAEKKSEAKVTEPGQIMEFEIVFTNNGEEDVNGVQVVDPIPANTSFISDSHKADVPASFEVSIDGGLTFEEEPVVRIETQTNGTKKEVVISPEQYTHVRWLAQNSLESDGGKHKFAYRVFVK